MGRRCAVTSCDNHNLPLDTIHSFPKNNDMHAHRRRSWEKFTLLACNGQTKITNFDNYGLCSRHFRESDYSDGPKRKLNVDSIPTILNGVDVRSNAHDDSNQSYKHHAEVFHLQHALDNEKKYSKSLEERIKTLEKQVQEGEKAKHQLASVLDNFSSGQQRMLLDKTKTRVAWNMDDVSRALPFFSINRKSYAYARKHLLPLPSESLIRKYIAKMELQPEKAIAPVFSLLNAHFIEESMHSPGVQCVLAMDEMSIDHRYCYDQTLDQVFGGSKNVTLYCARGVYSKWKQPLLYSFNGRTSHVEELTKLLYENGVNVVAVTSDLGPKNRKMWKDLGIGKVQRGVLQKITFPHPITGENIWWIPDFPHLFKRLRDHAVDSSIRLPGGAILDRTVFQKLITLQQKHENKLTWKLGYKHLYLKGQERQNCSTAFQLFSHTTAVAIRLLMQDVEGWEEIADFIEMVNSLSDLLNSRHGYEEHNPFKAAYGMYFQEQTALLNTASMTFMAMKVGTRKKAYAPFQKGLIMLIQGIQEIYQHLRNKVLYCDYLMLSRFNQDYLENVFSRIRGFGGFHPNPNSVQFKHRLRKLVLEWNIVTALPFTDNPISVGFSPEVEEQFLYIDPLIDPTEDYNFNAKSTEEIISEGSAEYVAGYIARKLRESHPELSADLIDKEERPFWVHALSKGGLVSPSNIWLAYFLKFEEYFQKIHTQNTIDMEPGIVTRFSERLCELYPLVPKKVIEYYVRCRVFIRIKYLNKRIDNEKFEKQHQSFMAMQAEDEEDGLDQSDDVEELSGEGQHVLKMLEDCFEF